MLIPHLLAQKRVSVATCWEAGRFLSDEIARLAATRIKDAGKPRPGPSAPAEISFRNLLMGKSGLC